MLHSRDFFLVLVVSGTEAGVQHLYHQIADAVGSSCLSAIWDPRHTHRPYECRIVVLVQAVFEVDEAFPAEIEVRAGFVEAVENNCCG